MDRVSVSHATQIGGAQQEGDRQPAMDEAVVHDHVRDAEGCHAGPAPDRQWGSDAVQIAANHHEARRDRSVEERQRVVALEAAGASRVMRAMDPVEPAMPHAAVEQP